jgi:hypothetical protein
VAGRTVGQTVDDAILFPYRGTDAVSPLQGGPQSPRTARTDTPARGSAVRDGARPEGDRLARRLGALWVNMLTCAGQRTYAPACRAAGPCQLQRGSSRAI